MMVLEYFFDAMQVYRSHVLFLLTYAVAYLLLNVIVTLEVRIVYKIITWRDYQSYIWATATLMIMILSFYLLVWIGQKKKGISNDNTESNNLKEETQRNNSD